MNEQQRLLNVIWNDDPTLLAESGFDIQGIRIYRINLLANAERALRITYPTIFELLDSDISKILVRDFLKTSPPKQGDWAQWGEVFSDFISGSEIALHYAYIPDCAKLDWYIHKALQGKDQTLEQTSLQVLGDTEPENIVIKFNPNVRFIKTKFPISDIFHAHHHRDLSQRTIAMEQAKIALSTINEEHVVMVYRPEYQPEVITLTQSEAEFMLCLNTGKSLSESLDAVNHHSDFSFEKWLVNAITQNLIYQFKEI